jgi:uncharacterized membrane protein YphA (DoxX/SURF4 family)
MNWYYAKNGHQNGPVPTEDMIDRVAMGEISPTDLAWCEGMADWLPVSQIPQLKVLPPVRDEMPAAAPTGAAPQQATPYQAPVAAAPAAAPSYVAPGQTPSQGLAIAAMVCGILSLVGCCVWPISGPLAIAAIVLGIITHSKAKANPGAVGGKGMAKAGMITGVLGLICAGAMLALGLYMSSMTPEQMDQMFEKFDVPEAQRQEFREKLEAERAKQQP